jgi:hypothetical protein
MDVMKDKVFDVFTPEARKILAKYDKRHVGASDKPDPTYKDFFKANQEAHKK